MIPRRAFLQASATLCAGPVQLKVAGALPAAPRRRKLTLATQFGVKPGGYSDNMYRLLCRIERACQGSLTFEFVPPPASAHEAVNNGAYDGHLALISDTFDDHPVVSFSHGMSEQRSKAWLDALPERLNVKLLIAGATGSSLGLWSRTPISNASDLAGASIFMRGATGRALEALGARRVHINTSAVSALKSNAIFAADCGDGPQCVTIGVAKAARFCAIGVSPERHAIGLAFSERAWASLSPAERSAFLFFTRQNFLQNLKDDTAAPNAYMAGFEAAHATTFYNMPPALVRKFDSARADAVAALERLSGII